MWTGHEICSFSLFLRRTAVIHHIHAIKHCRHHIPNFCGLRDMGHLIIINKQRKLHIGPFKIGNQHLFHYRYKIRYHNAVLPTLLKNA